MKIFSCPTYEKTVQLLRSEGFLWWRQLWRWVKNFIRLSGWELLCKMFWIMDVSFRLLIGPKRKEFKWWIKNLVQQHCDRVAGISRYDAVGRSGFSKIRKVCICGCLVRIISTKMRTLQPKAELRRPYMSVVTARFYNTVQKLPFRSCLLFADLLKYDTMSGHQTRLCSYGRNNHVHVSKTSLKN